MNRIVGWYQYRTRVLDDRGQLVEVRDARRRPREKPFRFLLPDWKSRNIRSRVWHVLQCIVMLLFTVLMAFIAAGMMYGLLKILITPSTYRMLAITIGFFVFACGVPGGIVLIGRLVLGWERRHALQIAGARLAASNCGSCNFDIADIVPTDGCTVCPECAAAWRVDLWKRDWSRRTSEGRNQLKSALPFDWARINLLANRPAKDRRSRLWKLWLVRFMLPSLTDAIVAGVGLIFILLSGLSPDLLISLVSSDRRPWVLIAIFVLGLRALWAGGRAVSLEVGRCVKQGLCPHCEHGLRAEPSHGDGALLCESCGLAWRGERNVGLWKVA